LFDLLSVGLAVILFWASVIDIRRMILPDFLTLPLIPAGLLISLKQPPEFTDRLIAAIGGYALFAGLAWGYRRFRHRDGLGMGDAKLIASAGAWVGVAALPSVILIGASCALVWALAARKRMDQRIPFGPFLALGFWLVWRFGALGVG
jgi:leader peptidase (prepilin peptidase)/N-methyltransferase